MEIIYLGDPTDDDVVPNIKLLWKLGATYFHAMTEANKRNPDTPLYWLIHKRLDLIKSLTKLRINRITHILWNAG